jgi:hypothetical protein
VRSDDPIRVSRPTFSGSVLKERLTSPRVPPASPKAKRPHGDDRSTQLQKRLTQVKQSTCDRPTARVRLIRGTWDRSSLAQGVAPRLSGARTKYGRNVSDVNAPAYLTDTNTGVLLFSQKAVAQKMRKTPLESPVARPVTKGGPRAKAQDFPTDDPAPTA